MDLTLLVLAAGLGSRYGGLKQLDRIGPGGETMLDYAAYDAIRSGFTRIVFVIRQDFEAQFREQVGLRYADRMHVEYVLQTHDEIPPDAGFLRQRTKPWGTGHAVWCARRSIQGPFMVINADDYYGGESYKLMAGFLREPPNSPPSGGLFAMMGFDLENTLSENGPVSRGICSVEGEKLLGIVEQPGIVSADVGPGRKFSRNSIVSMNCWGFTPALFPLLERKLKQYLVVHGNDDKLEFYLPTAVSAIVAEGEAQVRVLRSQATWFGITYREDKARVTAALTELAARGSYPNVLNRKTSCVSL